MALVIFATVGMALSCSDWDDHYGLDEAEVTASASLWENIRNNSELSQFAALIEKSGYAGVLDATQTYTIWAPANGTYNFDSLNALPINELRHHFIQNHIARYNFPASGQVEKNITMLNEKMMLFKGTNAYTLNGLQLTGMNVPSNNGVLHVINGSLGYLKNIYEGLSSISDIDSISLFYHSYELHELDEVNSVRGPVVDGRITYLDSVLTEGNRLFYDFRAYINREDSNYTMLIPTNEAWNKAYQHIKSYYNYVPSFKYVKNVPQTNLNRAEVDDFEEVNINAAYLQDSIVKQKLIQDLFYNNNIYDNGKLELLKTGEMLQADSLLSTSFTKIYADDASRLFEGAQKQKMSNGYLWLTDSLRMRPWTSWNPVIKIQAEGNVAYAYNSSTGFSTPTRITKAEQNDEVQGNVSRGAYQIISPASPASNPEVIFYLPNVRSTEYAVYICFVPENINKNTHSENLRPNRVMVTMGYNDEKGTAKEMSIRKYFSNDISKIDTVHVGDFTFPISYYGTGNAYSPYIRIASRASGNAATSRYDRNLRIDYIMLVPKELDNYLKEHPDYHYAHDIY